MQLSKEQKLLSAILHKAWEDDAFKSALIADPIDAIEAFTGQKIKIPRGKRMVVNDQSDSSIIHLNIPPKPDIDNIELSEEQLDIISGGGDPKPVITDPAQVFQGLID